MQPADFTADAPGQLVKTLEGCWAFAPAPLPPSLPSPSWEWLSHVSDADRALSELAGVARTLPNPHLLIRPFARREAVASSRIEGTRAGLSELLLFEVEEEEPLGSDVSEVVNYIMALEHGLHRLQELPVSLPLIREMHAILLRDVRGEDKLPGQFRKAQVWIGPPHCEQENARFNPPPPVAMEGAARALEKYIHEPQQLPPLVRLALIHYQFETIHPFMDGNGRIGRLLITLLLCSQGLLPQPLLYLSAYFEKHRTAYYDGLLAVSQRGEWMEWIGFFLRGVATQSRDAVRRAGLLMELRETWRQELQGKNAPATTLRLLDDLFSYPATSINRAAARLDMTYMTASKSVKRLKDAGILREATGRQRNRVFIASRIIEILEAPEV